jgi:hypothetical protein
VAILRRYKYKDGSKIEVEAVEMPPDFTYAMGECHVGECWDLRLFHATSSNGKTAQFDKWEEAKQFLFDN